MNKTKNLGELFEEAKIKHGFPRKKNVKRKKQRTGIYHVSLVKCDKCKQGFQWRYSYKENDKTRFLVRINLLDLKKEVKKRNFHWEVYDKTLAAKSATKAKISLDEILI